MEPRQVPGYSRRHGGDWWWLYNQPTVPLRGQCDLLARLMIAEVADMNMLQAIMLRWGTMISMRDHVEWMSVMWVKNVLMSLDEEEGCLGRRMESFRGVEAEVCAFMSNQVLFDGAVWIAGLVAVASNMTPLPPHLLAPSRNVSQA